jgi:hypothetical protein
MNKWLKGNGLWCAACKGTGRGKLSDIIEYRSGAECRFYHPCPTCDGQRRVEAPIADVIAGIVPATKPKLHDYWSQCIEYRAPPVASKGA